jgi:hypothetical protein
MFTSPWQQFGMGLRALFEGLFEMNKHNSFILDGLVIINLVIFKFVQLDSITLKKL